MLISNKITDSLELSFSKLAKKLNNKNKILYSLGLGEPNYPTPKLIINEAFNAMKNGLTRYSSPQGDFGLRRQIAKKLLKDNSIKAKPEEIIISAGSKMSLYLALVVLLKPHDHVICIKPSYTSYLPSILLSESKINITHFNLNSNFKINFEKLKKKVKKKTKLILINFPHNPTGQILKKKELEEFVKILIKNKDCYLVSDEVYEKNIFTQNKHLSPASVRSIASRVVTINGFSKSFSMTGWRIGYAHANKEIISQMVKVQQHILTNVPLFIQKAASKALQMKSNHNVRFNRILKKNHDYALRSFMNNKTLKFVKAYGGFFIFLKIKNNQITSDTFCTKLLKKHNIAVTPGKYFGTSFNSYIRISLSQDHIKFKKAIDLINKFKI